MFRFKKQPEICKKEDHVNIDVLCKLPWDEKQWPDRVCEKCFVPERFQEDEEYLSSRKRFEEIADHSNFLHDMVNGIKR